MSTLYNKIFYFSGFILIMSILFIIMSMISFYVRTSLKTGTIPALFKKYKGFRAVLAASLLGALTPFCSCTTVPIFSGLAGSKIDLRAALAFLIASPSINITAFILLISFFGIPLALLYLISCLTVSCIGSYLIRSMSGKELLRDDFIDLQKDIHPKNLKGSLLDSLKILKYYIFIFILAALTGTFLYNYIPESFINPFYRINSIYAVFIAVLAGAVIYADIIILVPIGYALLLKGINQGIIFAFMLSASGISIPGMILLSRIIKTRPLILLISTLLCLYTLLGIILYFTG